MRDLIALRRQFIVPLLEGAGGHAGRVLAAGEGIVAVDWVLRDQRLQLRANLGAMEAAVPEIAGHIFYAEPKQEADALAP